MSRSFRLGSFVFGALVLLAIGVFLVGDRGFLWSPTYRVKAQFDNVVGLAGGADVRVGGIRMGTVEQIQLPTHPNEKVTVVISLGTATRDIIKKDSKASIKTEGLLGNKYLEVSAGSADAPKVDDGDLISSEPPIDFADLIKKADEILENTEQTTSKLKLISSQINDGRGTIGALVKDKEVYENIAHATRQAKAGATAFHEDMQALKQNWFFRGFFNDRGYKDSADLTKHAISRLPRQAPEKRFVFDAEDLFGKGDSAKLKNQKKLDEVGQYLEKNQAGLTVVLASAGRKGETDENQVLTQARAMVVREHLVENFKMDDTRLKTLGVGETGGPGRVEIIVYPAGSEASAGNNRPAAKRR